MKIAWAVGIAAVLSGGWVFGAQAAPVAGVVTSLEGKPEIKARGTGAYKRIKRSQMVYEGDSLKTAAGEKLALVLVGGVEFRMNENSVFEVRSGGGGTQDASLFTRLGQAWTKRLSGMAGLRVKTPSAVAAVRGTEADVDAEEQQLTLKVYEGHVDLLDAGEANTLSSLTAGEMADAGASGVSKRAMSEGDYGTWQQGMEAKNLDKDMQRLQKEAEKTRTLKFKDKDGKELEIPIRKQ
ncbi:MAG: FecR domain-containing protein [Elusimicrobia bacterium]|nr:FecR domain-containing protein [Elusimicrobiota bacterium]